MTPHGLRHAHASWLLAGGADLQVVQERLGHGSITTTEKYLHPLPDAQGNALKALDAVRGRNPAHPEPATRASYRVSGSREGGDVDPRDAELAELRNTVAKFKEILGSLGNTA